MAQHLRFFLLLVHCCAGAVTKAADDVRLYNFLAVGAFVESVSGDDSRTGVTTMSFLLYKKRVQLNSTQLNGTTLKPGGECPDPFIDKADAKNFTDSTALRFANANGKPTEMPCPKGSEYPAFGFSCNMYRAELRYQLATATFPLDFKEFELIVEDDGPPTSPETNFCWLSQVTRTSPAFAQVQWAEQPQPVVHQKTQCYPPYTSDSLECSKARERKSLSIVWPVRNAKEKILMRYYLVPTMIIVLCLGLLGIDSSTDAKDRLKAMTALLFTACTFHFGILNNINIRNKTFSLFDSLMLWTYAVIYLSSFEACKWVWNDRGRKSEQQLPSAAVLEDSLCLSLLDKEEQEEHMKGVRDRRNQRIMNIQEAEKEKQKRKEEGKLRRHIDNMFFELILIGTVLQFIFTLLAIAHENFRYAVFVVILVFVVLMFLTLLILQQKRLPACICEGPKQMDLDEPDGWFSWAKMSWKLLRNRHPCTREVETNGNSTELTQQP